MNVPEAQREAKTSLKAYLAHRKPTAHTAASPSVESPTELWSRLFKEYGGEFPEDVRDGTEQQVYWVGGTTIVRSRVNGAWVYSVEEDSRILMPRVRCTGGC